jgi:tripartite-type tricarboxylate transporter receptor subunit TctC
MHTVRRHFLVLLAASAPLIPATLCAQTPASTGAWPSKPVRIVVPFAPGGTTDILARALAPELGKAFGQTFIIDNKPGAGGNLGADLVAKSPPDGYTLLMGTVGTQAINAALYPKMPFDPLKDLAPITMMAGVPNVLVMNPAKAQAAGIKNVRASSTWRRAATAPRSI